MERFVDVSSKQCLTVTSVINVSFSCLLFTPIFVFQSELFHWIDVLDLFDSILEKGVAKEKESNWSLPCDCPSNEQLKELLIHVVVFTSLLIEHSFSRHLYNSMEHLTTLLSSSDMQIVLAVLNLLYVFSKRSNFISRLNSDRRQALIQRLNYLAEVCIHLLVISRSKACSWRECSSLD